MNVDANGNLAISLLGIVGAIVAITFAVVAIKLIQQTAEVLSHVLPSAIESVQTYAIPKVKEEVRELVLPISLPKPKKPEAKHTVYALVDENKIVKNIGRTVNVTATTNKHRNNPARKNLKLVHLRDNLQYHEARILEEYYITYYKTLNKMDKRCNQIHGLRVSEKDYDAFMNFAEELSRETVYVGGGC